MTGYGRGDQAADGYRIEVELKGVNRKQAEIQLNLPRELDALESRVRDRVNSAVARGRVELRVSLTPPAGATAIRINGDLARAYAQELQQVAARCGPGIGPLSFDALLRLPGVMEPAGAAPVAEQLWPTLETALSAALTQFETMRQREGEALAADLGQRIARLREAAERITQQAPAVAVRYRDALRQRIAAAGVPGLAADDERVVKEVIIFADRSDISEELARLTSHFTQFDDCRTTREAVGRKLDFLAQEMNREINTIGAKANDALIAGDVVCLKTELERFREQAQNVE